MPIIPGTDVDLSAYLAAASGGPWYGPDAAVVEDALRAEMADQRSRCRVPVDDAGLPRYADVPALAEALCRRVAHNLAVRALPLGVQATVTDAAALATQVGGTDAEVRRLEAPHRKRKVG
ncbi:MAG TPA: hypothetical protein VGE38_08610 [Nocardioides sp.]|uniref:hypothetical protein n=1 Tax=Nocardioides sp. TaxID=35761 RepID=UPI002EDAA3DB